MHRYELVQEIGHGAYSIVFKAINKVNNSIVAIKRINHTNPDISIVQNREIHTLKTLQHPNIIKLYEVFSDQTYTYLVFEYLPFDLIAYYKEIRKTQNRNLNDHEITYISWQMCQALGYMHHCGIMHRDIKPENVLVDPATLAIKLIDFGFATRVNPYSHHTQYMITRWYRPLEIVLNLPYDTKSDIFALGALIMELYKGEEIFRSSSNIDQLYWILDICGYPTTWPQAIIKMSQLGVKFNVKKQPEIFKMVSKIRPQAANLLIGMLQTSPYSRISINEILRHSYFAAFIEQSVRKNPRQTVSHNIGNQNARYPQKLKTQNVHPSSYPQQSKYLTPSRSKDYIDFNLNLATLDNNSTKKLVNGQLSTERLRDSKNFQNYNAPLSQRQMSHSKQKQPPQNINFNKEKARQQGQKTDFQKHFKFMLNKQTIPRYKTEGQDEIQHHKYGLTPSNSQNHNHMAMSYMKRTRQEEQIKEQMKGLKNRTKSYQGISVVSLKRNHSNGAILGINPETPSNYFNNYPMNGHEIPRKEATFTKIRDKLLHESKPMGKIKISLTDRNLLYNDRRNASYQYG